MKHLQGTWTVTALEADGNQVPTGMLGESKIVVKGSRFTTIAMGAEYGGKLTIDETVVPHQLDLHFTNGPHKGLASLGIYELDDHHWTICLGFAGNQRPTAFETTPGSGHALETLTRDTSAGATTSERTNDSQSSATRGKKAGTSLKTSTKDSAAESTAINDDFPDEMEKIGGEWIAESIVSNGEPLPDMYLKMAQRVATGRELTVTVAGQVQLQTGFGVNPTTTPKSLNYFDVKKPGQPLTTLGIYELRGDTLTICMAPKGESRPEEFTSPKGGGRTLSVWKRSAPA